MKILSLETSTEACSVALWQDGTEKELFELAPNRHSVLILSMVDAILAESELSISDCDAVAFGQGPGSFTGLRIGVGVAQGLAFGADVPVIPVSSLQALMMRIRAPDVLVALDARMNQIYWSTFNRKSASSSSPEGGVKLSEAGEVRLSKDRSWVACGSGCDRYQPTIDGANPGVDIQYVRNSHPHALDVARIAAKSAKKGEYLPPERATPDYVRNKVTG